MDSSRQLHPSSVSDRQNLARESCRYPLERDQDEAWIAGVASGLARHLDWPIWLARMMFVALTATSFVGCFIYGLLWLLMSRRGSIELPPGCIAADHQGMRPLHSSQVTRLPHLGRVSSVMLIVLGIILLVQSLGFGVASPFFVPALLAGIGMALVWLQADLGDEHDDLVASLPVLLRPLIAGRGGFVFVRISVGLILIALAISMIGSDHLESDDMASAIWLGTLTLVGAFILAAPWLLRLRKKLDTAQREKLIADTRADMAAHLHDSVLQTLALIQRQAQDPKRVASLARRQERELRTWLYGQSQANSSFKEALNEAASEVDEARSVPIEVICVGDTSLDEKMQAMVQAAREAMMNAAKHSGSSAIDVFADVESEGEQTKVQVFIRDRGRGFDMSAIAPDRMGVRGSIIDRMERHGGSAVVRSAPGEGTEIRLEMTR